MKDNKVEVQAEWIESDSCDQWTEGGDCSKCRKESYCGSKCKMSKMYLKYQIAKAFSETRAGAILDVLSKEGVSEDGI